MKTKKTMSRALAIALVLAIFCTCLSGCGGSGSSADESTTFSWWLASAENTDYYIDYDENPVVQYISNYLTFESSDGEQVHIGFDYQNGVSGSEQDNFNNMMATGTYTDVIDTTYLTDSFVDLYEQGTILDMTEYVEAYMPNYLAYIEAHPELAKYFTTNVNGEERYLALPCACEKTDMYDQWYGYMYRRDWIVKYGVQPDEFYDPMTDSAPTANPNAGQSFSGCYTLDNDGNEISATELTDNVNGDSWVDDVVFPSGHSDPVYISDWEWMMEIFETAMEAEGITDGYCISLYYPGYLQVGDLVSGFGGIGPMWYIDENGECQFGATSESFKSYLECMNTWYNNGWLDKQFSERTSDAFYQIDDTAVRQGKVGIWLGTVSELLTRMQSDELEHTSGIIAYAAATPINDVYGAEESQLKEPTVFFGPEIMGGAICVTDKAADKDLKVLCEYLDYLFSEEGVLLTNGGLTAEQMAEAQDETYQAYGLDYAYTPVEGEDGMTLIDLVDVLDIDDGGIKSAMTGARLWRLSASYRVVRDDTDTYTHMREVWVTYTNSGSIEGMLNSRMTDEASSNYQKVNNRIGAEFMYIEVPKFIKGEYDLAEDWDVFQENLAKRDYQSVIDGYNEALAVGAAAE